MSKFGNNQINRFSTFQQNQKYISNNSSFNFD